MQKRLLLIFLAAALLVQMAHAQYVYAIRYINGSPTSNSLPAYLVLLDLNDCNMCVITPLNDRPEDMVVLPGGELLVLVNSDVGDPPAFYFETYNPPGTTPTNTSAEIAGFRANSMAVHNGVIYLTINSDLYTYNVSTNQTTLVGTLGPGIVNPTLYAFNGQLQVVSNSGISTVFAVNLAAPANSTVLGTIGSGLGGVSDAVVVDGAVLIAAGCFGGTCGPPSILTSVYSLNTTNYTASLACDIGYASIPPATINITGSPPFGMVEAPDDHTFYPCVCANTAGGLFMPALICGTPNQVNVAVTSSPIPGNGDVVRYYLVSDTTNIAGSIIATSTTNTINLPPNVIQYGVPYYVVIAVGELLNGVMNFADACTRISYAWPVVWQPRPTLELNSTATQVCQSGGCVTVTATVSGAGPYSLTYLLKSGNTVLSTQTVTSTTSPFDFEICAPTGMPVGVLTVEPVSVNNAACTCQ